MLILLNIWSRRIWAVCFLTSWWQHCYTISAQVKTKRTSIIIYCPEYPWWGDTTLNSTVEEEEVGFMLLSCPAGARCHCLIWKLHSVVHGEQMTRHSSALMSGSNTTGGRRVRALPPVCAPWSWATALSIGPSSPRLAADWRWWAGWCWATPGRWTASAWRRSTSSGSWGKAWGDRREERNGVGWSGAEWRRECR